jgi:tRNA (mo5U34)-methyltransferase
MRRSARAPFRSSGVSGELTPKDIQREVNARGKWFHNITLHGVQTAPDHFLGDFPTVKWRHFAQAIPSDLTGLSVLDIGCNGGFYSLEMKRRGAKRVLGIDSNINYLEQARFAAAVLGLAIEFRHLSVYDLAVLEEQFDLVIFMGVLYHLRHPLLALDLIRRHAARDLLLFQSMIRGLSEALPLAADYPFGETEIFERHDMPRLCFIERSFAGDPTNWWIPNRTCVEAMLRSSGFEILKRPEEEVYLCRCAASTSEES